MDFGPFTPAVEHWERVLGRPAPCPVNERGRLSAVFAEWMMGLPHGWVTGVPGLPNRAQFTALGNAVVPAQARLAVQRLLAAPLV